jgi:translation initiation factor IF-3
MPDTKNESKKTVRLNGREISREELIRQQEAAVKQKGVDLKEVSPSDFKMRLKG